MTIHRGWQSAVTIGIVALFMTGSIQAQTQSTPTVPAAGQPAANDTPQPLDLPPLPRKRVPVQQYGDWSKQCEARPGTEVKNCYLTQMVVQSRKDKRQGILLLAVGYYGPKKTPGVIMRVPLALGVYLPTGLTLTVPGTAPIKVVIESCLPQGCNGVAKLSTAAIAAMKNANKGSVELRTLRRQQVKLPVSFKGITAGLASLNKG